MNQNLRQLIHDRVAEIADWHAATRYPGVMETSTAERLFALLADTALAYLMEVEAELADPGPRRSLAATGGLTAKDTLLTGLRENIDLKNDDPGAVPVNGWLAWRTTADDPPDQEKP